jgi:O-antigen ligase
LKFFNQIVPVIDLKNLLLIDLKNLLQKAEFALLALMILTLPSLEAPKNIFLVFFVFVALLRQVSSKELHGWGVWDWIFLSILASAFMSSIFAGMHTASEWKGFRVLLTYLSVGWLTSRSQYSSRELQCLFFLVLIGTVPPLIMGLVRYLYLHNKPDLQLHSVGHVNHSAIYLTMVFGASLGASLSLWSAAERWLKLCLIALPFFFFVSLIIGQSRAAVGIGFALAILLVTLLVKDNRIRFTALLSILLIAIMAIVLNVEVVQKERNNEKRNDVLASRDKVWNVSIEAAQFSPVLGVGLSNWGKIKPDDIKRALESRGESYDSNNYMFAGHSHSLYLTTLVERGVVGSIVMFSFMIAWLFHLIKNLSWSKKAVQSSYLWAASFSAWLVSFGIGLVNTTMHHEHGILAFLFLGLFLAYSKKENESS